MSNYTLTYSPSAEGWPSFYSFNPEFMIGMNQFFYSFKRGNLFRHNSDGARNTFYGTFTPTSMTSVFNQGPIEKKVFKTIALESDDRWFFSGVTELEEGNINKMYFELKESTYFSHIRGLDSIPASIPAFLLRTTQGIGNALTVATAGGNVQITYSIDINQSLSVGDVMYHDVPTKLAGVVSAVNRETKTITVTPVAGSILPVAGSLTLFVKNGIAESNGIRGDYMVFTLINDNSAPIELFAIKSEVFKSFP